jgi:hypothetical protein
MRFKSIIIGCILLAGAAWPQSDRGTLTGTVSDPSGAVVPRASVVARDSNSGAEYRTSTTDTGNYTITSLPAGGYQVSIEASGFKKHVQKGITIQVAQTARVDVVLQIGSTTDAITVTADAPLLRTENAEQSTTIGRDRLNDLPLNFAGLQVLRDPLAFAKLTPGAYVSGITGIRINGLPTASFKVVLEGQDITSPNLNDREDENHPSVEMLQEFTVQASNFAAEFGQVGSGLFNFTARSGTNQVHGSGYDYLVNEDLNAGQPFTNSGHGHLIRPKNRQNDWGFTIGGPWYIPKLYDGRNKTFFFFNWEQYRQKNGSIGFQTVPTDAMRNGDFSGILTGRQVGTDVLGRAIMENTIYDPATARAAPSGQMVTDAFPGNIIIPKSRFDALSAKVQAMIPAATGSGLVNNYSPLILYPKIESVPAIKVDQIMSDKWKLSFLWSQIGESIISSNDGLPIPLTSRRDQPIYSDTYRLSSDYTVTPTLFVHAGVGYIRDHNRDSSPPGVTDYDAQGQLGLKNVLDKGFPHLGFSTSSFGGFANSFNGNGFGPTQRNEYWTDKATAVASLTWVHGNHTYKAGAEWRLDMWVMHSAVNVSGGFNFSPSETALPYLGTTTVGGAQIGFPYASFLLGQVDSGVIGNQVINQYHRPYYGVYVQDTWKITPKLTLDYGLRWDYTGGVHERFYRTSAFAPSTPNPSAGGLMGAMAYEGFGPGRCNCDFMPTYPYALGPRLGAAYRLDSKTVLRAGWGLTYGQAPVFNYLGTNTVVVGVGFNVLNFSAPSFGVPNTTLSNGFQYNSAAVYAASLDPGIRPLAGQVGNSPSPWFDKNGGRPGRINNWNIALQREITPNLVVEAAYVGNRGVWLTSGDASNIGMNNLNALTIQRIAAVGLNVTNAADRSLLTSTFASGAPQQRGFQVPYPGFPTGLTLAQALRPYPQFATIYTEYSPLGNSWYDALQMKVTKRFSHGLELLTSFTWSKQLDEGFDTERGRGAQINDSLNRAVNKDLTSTSQPFVLVTSFTYQIPVPSVLRRRGLLRHAFEGWTLGGLMSIGSGLPIRVPGSTNNLSQLLFQSTFVNRVPGASPYLQNPNCHCFDPNTTAVLNPAAWVDPGPGNWGTAAAYYNDYRWQRLHDEEASLAKTFKFKEGATFQVRAEFFNVFNRTVLPMPSSGNITTPQTQAISGFGRLNPASVGSPRTGQIVARIQF